MGTWTWTVRSSEPAPSSNPATPFCWTWAAMSGSNQASRRRWPTWGRKARRGRPISLALWLADHDVSMLVSDHPMALDLTWAIGLVHVINVSFTALRAALRQRDRGPVGTLVIAPLPLRGATGEVVNPLVLL